MTQYIGKYDADFSEIYTNHVSSLYSYGLSLGFCHDICLDAIQDIFCRLYQKKPAEIGNIKYYLFRSLRNKLIDVQRSEKKDILQDINDLPFSVEVSVTEDQMIVQEERELMIKKVESLMKKLTDRQREAIYLRYMQELEYDEIGRLMNMNAESVRKLVYRGIEKLRQETGSYIILFIILQAAVYYALLIAIDN